MLIFTIRILVKNRKKKKNGMRTEKQQKRKTENKNRKNYTI